MDQDFEERRRAAWIGKALFVQGKIVSSADLVIDGKVEGTLELGDHSLTIRNGATVIADLVANIVSISGFVKGNVSGLSKVEIRATGSVEGDIRAPHLVMEDGAVLRGRVDAAGRRNAAVK